VVNPGCINRLDCYSGNPFKGFEMENVKFIRYLEKPIRKRPGS
jgi:hypothetical protein